MCITLLQNIEKMNGYILDLIDFQNLMQKNIVSQTKNELYWKQFIPVLTGLIEKGEKVEDFPVEIRALYTRETAMIPEIHEKSF